MRGLDDSDHNDLYARREDEYRGHHSPPVSATKATTATPVSATKATTAMPVSATKATTATLTKATTDTSVSPSKLRIVSDLSTYSAKVQIAWDAPSALEVGSYVIYVNGIERYETKDNTYMFVDMAPNTEYVITIRAASYAGYRYKASEPLTIKTGYNNMLFVGKGQTYETIQAGINAAKPGDVVIIKNGFYKENVSAPAKAKKSGTEDQWITVMAESYDAKLFGVISLNVSYYRLCGLYQYAYREVGASEATEVIEGKTYLKYDEKEEVKTDESGKRYILLASGSSAVSMSGNYVQLEHMKLIGGFGGGINIAGDHILCANNQSIRNNTGAGISGNDNLVCNNEFAELGTHHLRSSGDSDYFRVFGYRHILRGNYCHGTEIGTAKVGKSHVDFVQAFDNNSDVSRDMLFENNILTGSVHQAFMLENDSYPEDSTIANWTIRNNIITGYGAWGICAGKEGGSEPNMVVENNIFMGAKGAYHGLHIIGYKGSMVVRNNIIMNTNNAYGVNNGAVLVADHNVIFNVRNQTTYAENNIIADPLFVNPDNFNFNLQAGSPAIDAGYNTGLLYDMNGNARPIGGGIDIGPIEYGAQPDLVPQVAKPQLVGMELSPEVLEFDPSITTYDVEVSYLVDGVRIVPAYTGGKLVLQEIRAVDDKTGTSAEGKTGTSAEGKTGTSAEGKTGTDAEGSAGAGALGPVAVQGDVLYGGKKSDIIPLAYGKNTLKLVYDDGTSKTTYTICIFRKTTNTWNALEGYSGVQGRHQWYYYSRSIGSLVNREIKYYAYKQYYMQTGSNYQCRIGSNRMQSDNSSDAVRAWKAPRTGTAVVTGDLRWTKQKADGDGNVVTIMKNDEVVWGPQVVSDTTVYSHRVLVDVEEGDMIYFIVNKNQTHDQYYGTDWIYWNPTVTLHIAGEPPVGDANGDYSVDQADLTYVAQNLGKSGAGTEQASDWAAVEKADLNKDGKINIVDLATVARQLK